MNKFAFIIIIMLFISYTPIINATTTNNTATVRVIWTGVQTTGTSFHAHYESVGTQIYANDLCFLLIAVGDRTNTPSVTGFTNLFSDAYVNGDYTQYVFYKICDGTEDTTTEIAISCSGSATKTAMTTTFYNCYVSSFYESDIVRTGNAKNVGMSDVISSVAKGLFLSFESVNYNANIDDSTGESNGNWARVTTSYGSGIEVTIQKSSCSAPTTITGGTAQIGDGLTNRYYINRSFYLLPNNYYSYSETQSLTTASAVSKIKEYFESLTQSLTIASSIKILREYLRGLTQSLTTASSATMLREYLRGLTQSLTTASSTTVLREYLVSMIQKISLSNSVSLLMMYIVNLTQSIGLFSSLDILREYLIGLAQVIHIDSILNMIYTTIAGLKQTIWIIVFLPILLIIVMLFRSGRKRR